MLKIASQFISIIYLLILNPHPSFLFVIVEPSCIEYSYIVFFYKPIDRLDTDLCVCFLLLLIPIHTSLRTFNRREVIPCLHLLHTYTCILFIGETIWWRWGVFINGKQ